MLAERTLYNYVDAGLFTAGNLDLPRKVRYKVRKKKSSVRVDRNCTLAEHMKTSLSTYKQIRTHQSLRLTLWKDGKAARFYLQSIFAIPTLC